MVKAAFSHVSGWVFDLDNTLYPPQARLFDQIEKRMHDIVDRDESIDRENWDRDEAVKFFEGGKAQSPLPCEQLFLYPIDFQHK